MRTFIFTLTAELALLIVDVSQVVGDGDSIERTYLLALATTDTTYLTSLASDGALILVYTKHYHAAAILALVAQLDDHARTSLHTCATSRTFLSVNLGKTCCGVHANSIELTCSHTVATTQTAEGAACLATARSMGNLT